MRLFLSYAQADQDFRDQLVKHLRQLKRDRILDTWDAHEITGGTERDKAISEQLEAADIILLLISADFIDSDRYDTEMQRAIERHENQEARVIPILLKPCDWESAPFAGLEVLPKGGKPVTAGDLETAFAAIAQEIRKVAIELNPALAKPAKVGMKLGAPLPGVRLPENYVERPEALNAVKALLLEESEKPLVVSAISGLGGLGKSVLAAALALDPEVQQRFEDGILWVTLGQNPDLQNLVADWIRTLDKSRESYSATTLESASRYLQTLLLEKRMLLVVDDVWNGAHVEPFRVGGSECRILVTTREAQIEGAEIHSLNLMSEDEAIDLVRRKLRRQWKVEQETEVKTFAKSLGYLPLALDLAANQVRDGLSWTDLRSEFEDERRAVALEVLDASEAWETLDEARQRKYSLRACFNLSLRRLSAEQLRQFAWLGVLPEDVSLDVHMAMTLWELPKVQAKKLLVLLKNRSFLTSGTETLDGESTFRVHDLMHDTARGLLEQGALADPLASLQTPIRNPKTKLQNLVSAHVQLLERYREQANGRWNKLPNDGYIHRHLTWHFVQAGMENEIHALMAMSDEQGRNAWFETCDRIGQPAIFVQDVKRGWEVAEQQYEKDKTRAIVLQCQYALITATLNSLVENLPIGIVVQCVKRKWWTPEQAWAYVEQIQDENKFVSAIQGLAPYVSEIVLEQLVKRVRLIQDEIRRAEALASLAEIDKTYLEEAIHAVQSIQDQNAREGVLINLDRVSISQFSQSLDEIRAAQDTAFREKILYELAQAVGIIPYTDQPSPVIKFAFSKDEEHFSSVSDALTKVDQVGFLRLLSQVRSIKNKLHRLEALGALAWVEKADLAQLLNLVWKIQDEYYCARALSTLARIDEAYLPEAIDAAKLIQNELSYAIVLRDLVRSEKDTSTEQLMQNKHSKNLSQFSHESRFSYSLDIINALAGKPNRASALSKALSCFSQLYLARLSYLNWTFCLHLLAHRTRADLMQDLATLYPAIVHLGGKEAVRGMVDAMRDVCNQWK